MSGLHARGHPDTVQPDDRWHIGSITKSMTALLLASYVADASCGFETELGALAALPMHPALARCRLRELLAHRSGLRGNPSRAQCFPPGVQDHDAPEGAARDAMLAPALLQAPGRRAFAYSNLGYMLAGHLAEQLGGAPWKTLLQRRIAAPLGLDSLGFGPPAGDAPQGHMAWLTAIGRRSLQPRPGRAVARDAVGADLSVAMGPAGLVHMSLPDLLRYGIAIAGMARGDDGIVPAAVFRALITGERYAGGWVLAPDTLWHNGSNGLWFAELRIQPAQWRASAFVTNTGALPAMLAASRITSQLAKRMGAMRPR
ncbi:serine hydrolase domain-containing protein [Luteimonas sp. RIT-PG2_3]